MIKNFLLFGFMMALLFSCELTSDPTEKVYVAEVVGYDLNCATCILHFPNDTAQINDLLGYSPFDYYHAVNLNMEDFAIGQLVKVKARQAMDTELRACIELYATYDYPYIYVTEYEQYRDSDFIDTLELNAGACVTTYGQANLCFDSVVNDSRCPIGAVCCWEGNAEVKLDLTITGQGKHDIRLNTHSNFPSDTTIGHLNISLVKVTPYPDLDREIKPEDYRVKLSVTNDMLCSLTPLFAFNTVQEGVNSTPNGGQLYITTGTYNGNSGLIINSALTILPPATGEIVINP